MAISPDLPEFRAIAELANLDPDKAAAAFNDPLHFFDHLTLEELGRLKDGCGRFAALQIQMVNAMDVYSAYGKGFLEGIAKVEEPALAD